MWWNLQRITTGSCYFSSPASCFVGNAFLVKLRTPKTPAAPGWPTSAGKGAGQSQKAFSRQITGRGGEPEGPRRAIPQGTAQPFLLTSRPLLGPWVRHSPQHRVHQQLDSEASLDLQSRPKMNRRCPLTCSALT